MYVRTMTTLFIASRFDDERKQQVEVVLACFDEYGFSTNPEKNCFRLFTILLKLKAVIAFPQPKPKR